MSPELTSCLADAQARWKSSSDIALAGTKARLCKGVTLDRTGMDDGREAPVSRREQWQGKVPVCASYTLTAPPPREAGSMSTAAPVISDPPRGTRFPKVFGMT